MEKYYVAQLDDLDRRDSVNKLVEVRFVRRPSTFGVLYVAKWANNQEPRAARAAPEQWLRLATLSLTLDNKAKFALAKEVKLAPYEQAGRQQDGTATSDSSVVDFETFAPGQLLVEGSSVASVGQTLQSSVFALTGGGSLLVLSMLDCSSVELVNTARCQSGERFFQVGLSRQRASGGPLQTRPSKTSFTLLALSNRCLYQYATTLDHADATFQSSNVQLVGKFPDHLQEPAVSRTLDGSHHRVEFIRMLPAVHGEIVLLQAANGALRILRGSECLACLPAGSSGLAQAVSMFSSSDPDEPHILLVLTRSLQLVAHSLVVKPSEDDKGKLKQTVGSNGFEKTDTNPGRALGRAEQAHDEFDKDPDGLFPEEPPFEMEQCWSTDLNEVEGVRSVFDDDEDKNEQENGPETSPGPSCLCLPLWSTPSSTPKKASLSDTEIDEQTEGGEWPRFLLVMCRHHVLIFNFEQNVVLPFSVVYDRAFLNLTSVGSDESSPAVPAPSSEQIQDKRVDLRVEPSLLHNIKLIGTRASDSLFNMLFLSCKMHFVQARHFSQLGLWAAISSAGHVIAFKITSPKLVGPNHKDNLYQQLLADSLREPSLLQDELQRMLRLEEQLKRQVLKVRSQIRAGDEESANLERIRLAHSKVPGNQQAADLLQVKASLGPHESDGALYSIDVGWPSLLLEVTKVVVVSNVEASRLHAPVQPARQFPVAANKVNAKIKSASIADEEQLSLEGLYRHRGSESKESLCPIRARAVFELEPPAVELNGGAVPETDSHMTHITVPISLKEFSRGQIKIYLAFSLHPFESPVSYGHQSGSAATLFGSEVSRFISREVQVKTLTCYKLVLDGDAQLARGASTVSFSGPIGLKRALVWLDGILNLPQPLPIKTAGANEITLTFQSNSRESSLRAQLSPDSVSFASGDLEALELIKQHTLNQATDSSVQLKLEKLLA